MLKSLYEHFMALYTTIHTSYPTLASEHALRQEDEVYKKSTKQTYRVVRGSPLYPMHPVTHHRQGSHSLHSSIEASRETDIN